MNRTSTARQVDDRPLPSRMESPGRALTRVIANFDLRALPDDVTRSTRLFVLDTLGVLAGGARAPGIAELRTTIGRLEAGDGPATVLIGGDKVSAPAAALVNGSSAHALDFDDTHDEGRIHAFSVVLPAALAAAEVEGHVSGIDFLAALTLGAELFCRLGLACPTLLSTGFHPTTGLGALAGAAAAGRILRLDAEQMMHALGLAFVQMSGTTQSLLDGAHSKRLGAGIAARNGVTAAYLAQAGLTGPSRFLEGQSGLFNLHARQQGQPEILTEGWGETWRIRELSMKPYPCCRCTHTLIDLAIQLHREGVRPDDIREGQLYLGKTNQAIVGAPFNPEEAENPVVHAQFSACYTFARAFIDGDLGIEIVCQGEDLCSRHHAGTPIALRDGRRHRGRRHGARARGPHAQRWLDKGNALRSHERLSGFSDERGGSSGQIQGLPALGAQRPGQCRGPRGRTGVGRGSTF